MLSPFDCLFPPKNARRKEKDTSRLTRTKIGQSGNPKIPQMADACRTFFRYNENGAVSAARWVRSQDPA